MESGGEIKIFMNISTDKLFFSLLRAGLWGRTEDGADYSSAQWRPILGLAREQTVVGIVSDGIAALRRSGVSLRIPPEFFDRLLVQTIGIERSNARLDKIVAELSGILRENGISYCLVKGQGTARNYPRPDHRTPGDIDFLLDDENYHKASKVLAPKAEKLLPENEDRKHFGMLFHDGVDVELHGTSRAGFGDKFNDVMDSIQSEMFGIKDFRSWDCCGERVALPSANFDALFVLTHFIQHFYHGGLGIRQVCDWTMHLDRYSSVIDQAWLRRCIDGLGLDREWKAFGSLAVNLLGLPREKMPFYDEAFARYSKMIWASIRHSGNFGRTMSGGRDIDSEAYLLRKTKSLIGHMKWMSRHFSLSPRNTCRAIRDTLSVGFSAVLKGN